MICVIFAIASYIATLASPVTHCSQEQCAVILEYLSMFYIKCNQILICIPPGHITDGRFSHNWEIITENIAYLVACKQRLLCFKMVKKFKVSLNSFSRGAGSQ